MGEWLDLAGAVELLGAPEETVARWVRQGLLPCRGSLPAVRLGSHRLLSMNHVNHTLAVHVGKVVLHRPLDVGTQVR